MTILEMIEEWRRGCSLPEGMSPYDCRECTLALIHAIENKAKEDATSASNEIAKEYAQAIKRRGSPFAEEFTHPGTSEKVINGVTVKVKLLNALLIEKGVK